MELSFFIILLVLRNLGFPEVLLFPLREEKVFLQLLRLELRQFLDWRQLEELEEVHQLLEVLVP